MHSSTRPDGYGRPDHSPEWLGMNMGMNSGPLMPMKRRSSALQRPYALVGALWVIKAPTQNPSSVGSTPTEGTSDDQR